MSLKQDWQRERILKNHLILESICKKVKSISTSPSTTNAEALVLRNIEFRLNDVIESFNNENSHTISFEKYERIKGGIKTNGL